MKGKKLLAIELQGRYHTYSFHFYGDPGDIEIWEHEGFKVEEVVHEEDVDIEQLYNFDTSNAH